MENCFVCGFYFYAIKDENQPNAAKYSSASSLADLDSILDSSNVGNFCESMDIYPLPKGITDEETLSLCHRCSIASSKILLLQEQINHLQNQVSQLQYSVAEKALLTYYNNVDDNQQQDAATLAAEEASTGGVVRKLLRDRWEERPDEVQEKKGEKPGTGLPKKENVKSDIEDKKNESAALRPSASSLFKDMKKQSASTNVNANATVYQPNVLYVKDESGQFRMASVFNEEYNTKASDNKDYGIETGSVIRIPGRNRNDMMEYEDTEEYGIDGSESRWELEESGGDSNEGMEMYQADEDSNDIIIEEVKSTAESAQNSAQKNNVMRLLPPAIVPVPSFPDGILLPVGQHRIILPKPPSLLMPSLQSQSTQKKPNSSNLKRSKQPETATTNSASSNSSCNQVRICPYLNCGKEFTNAERYKEHINVHNGTGPSCPFCKKIFPRTYNLTLHIRSHTGEKPHVCPICSQKYADKSNLNTHIRKHHEKPFHCSICQKMFGDMTSSQAHVLTFHPERKERNLIRLTRLVKAGSNLQ